MNKFYPYARFYSGAGGLHMDGARMYAKYAKGYFLLYDFAFTSIHDIIQYEVESNAKDRTDGTIVAITYESLFYAKT